MRKGFEVNGDYRLMDSSELVYILTSSAVMVNMVQEKEVVYGEECSFDEILAKMDTGQTSIWLWQVWSFINVATLIRAKDRLLDRVQIFMTICTLLWEITRQKNVGLSI